MSSANAQQHAALCGADACEHIAGASPPTASDRPALLDPKAARDSRRELLPGGSKKLERYGYEVGRRARGAAGGQVSVMH